MPWLAFFQPYLIKTIFSTVQWNSGILRVGMIRNYLISNCSLADLHLLSNVNSIKYTSENIQINVWWYKIIKMTSSSNSTVAVRTILSVSLSTLSVNTSFVTQFISSGPFKFIVYFLCRTLKICILKMIISRTKVYWVRAFFKRLVLEASTPLLNI